MSDVEPGSADLKTEATPKQDSKVLISIETGLFFVEIIAG